MSNFEITPIDGSLVALVCLVMQALKAKLGIQARWLPVMPFVVSFILTAAAIIWQTGYLPAWPVLFSGIFLEGIKVAVLAMAAFKVTKTTILGK